MKKNDYCMMKPLSGEEHVQVSGGYVPPTLRRNRWRNFVKYMGH
ncbi:hypothetical protein [Phocaeicola sp.]